MFNYLDAYAVSETTTAEYQLPIKGRPVLVMAPSSVENRALFVEALRDAPVAEDERKLTPEERVRRLDRTRQENARTLARHCLRGWRGVVDSTGAEVPYTPQAGEEFLLALASKAGWIFDRLNAWTRDPANFCRQAVFDAEQHAKN